MAAESQWRWMVLTVIWTKITMMVKKSSVFSIYSELNATFAINEIITITSPTLAMSITS